VACKSQIQNNKFSNRDVTLDILRGFAILVMIPGNMAAYVLAEPYPVWWRIYAVFGSFVPALFILLAGMMVVYTTRHRSYQLSHFLYRAFFLVVAGAILDILIWQTWPFLSIEVLYLIGLSLPICHDFQKLSTHWRWLTVATIFLLTPVLQHFMGYTPSPLQLSIFQSPQQLNPLTIAQHWLIDGWFPIFPWLGFALLGVNLGCLRLNHPNYNKAHATAIGFILLVIGSVIWWQSNTPSYIRNGFTELIYPPSLGYIITNLGMIALYFVVVDSHLNWRGFNPLRIFGHSALLVYLLHFFCISYLIAPQWQNESTEVFLLINLIFIPLMYVISYWRYKKR
jgi:uncharacterized membrane protein